MVPMHLGLIDGPLVPHNLISAQESPIPLPVFQMDPIQNLNIHWVQERNSDIIFFSLKKFRQTNPLQVPQRKLYIERDTNLQFIFYIYLYLKGPKKRASLHVPPKKSRAPFQSLT